MTPTKTAMKIELISDGICKGMKVLSYQSTCGNNKVYFDGSLTDEECINKFFFKPTCSATPITQTYKQ